MCVCGEPLDRRPCNQLRNPGVWQQVRYSSLRPLNSGKGKRGSGWTQRCRALCVRQPGGRESSSSAGMASSPCGNSNFDSGLEIKTRSVEQTLIPLVSQVSAPWTQSNLFYCYFSTHCTFKLNTTAALFGHTRLTLTGVYLRAHGCYMFPLSSRVVFKVCEARGEFNNKLLAAL